MFHMVGETSRSRCSRSAGPSDAIRASERVSPAMAQKPFFYRSAGACPPRALDCVNDGEGNSQARVAWRGTGPRPTGRGVAFFYRSAGACPPRALECADDGEGNSQARVAWRGTGPRPTVRGGVFLP